MSTFDLSRGLTLPGGNNLGKAILPQTAAELWRSPNTLPFILDTQNAIYSSIPFINNEYLQQVLSGTGLFTSFMNELNSIFGPVYIRYSINNYVFDGIVRAEHTKRTRITSHPVQTGANITDHAFIEPNELMLEIAMSDAMRDKVAGQFGTGDGRSQKAYETLVAMQKARQPLTVVTRLETYNNMLIENISVPDDNKTIYGLSATVTLKEIFIVEVGTTTVSARPQTTNTTQGGDLQAESTEDKNESTLSKIEGVIKG